MRWVVSIAFGMYSNPIIFLDLKSRLDRKIDDLVYELYGLTEEEIRILEGNG